MRRRLEKALLAEIAKINWNEARRFETVEEFMAHLDSLTVQEDRYAQSWKAR
jgi:hypothetical protein